MTNKFIIIIADKAAIRLTFQRGTETFSRKEKKQQPNFIISILWNVSLQSLHTPLLTFGHKSIILDSFL